LFCKDIINLTFVTLEPFKLPFYCKMVSLLMLKWTENNARNLNLYILKLKYSNYSRLLLNYWFMTLYPFKVPFFFFLAIWPLLNVGVKINEKCHMWLACAYVRSNVSITPNLKKKKKKNKSERGRRVKVSRGGRLSWWVTTSWKLQRVIELRMKDGSTTIW
jgi:hypothetical protein